MRAIIKGSQVIMKATLMCTILAVTSSYVTLTAGQCFNGISTHVLLVMYTTSNTEWPIYVAVTSSLVLCIVGSSS